MSASASKIMSAKLSASVQSGDSSSVLKISLMVGGAVLAVLLLIFLYKKFVAKKPKNEYFENNEYFDGEEVELTDEEKEQQRLAALEPQPPTEY
jgi:hypothetical protein